MTPLTQVPKHMLAVGNVALHAHLPLGWGTVRWLVFPLGCSICGILPVARLYIWCYTDKGMSQQQTRLLFHVQTPTTHTLSAFLCNSLSQVSDRHGTHCGVCSNASCVVISGHECICCCCCCWQRTPRQKAQCTKTQTPRCCALPACL